jgi:hypothetical protein
VWEPEYPTSRPPFQPGNTLAETHGADVRTRRVGGRAEEILARYKADPSWPPYLDDPSWSAALKSWSRAEAVCELLVEYMSDMEIEDANSDIITTEENTHVTGNPSGEQWTTRRSKTKRSAAPLEMLRKFETIASNHRNRLGLDPLGRARLGKDISATSNPDLARYWSAEQS